MLVLCDFDGTITLQDVTNLIWDHFIGPSWRGDLLSSYKHGHISHQEIMQEGYRGIRQSAQELLDWVRPQVGLRAGFDHLRQRCEQMHWPLVVVSGGLDFYIEAFLPPSLPFYSYHAEMQQHWEVSLPKNVRALEAEDFKVHVMKLLKKQHRKEKVVFIGDGRNDFPVAQMADRIFAVKGSTLARLCAERGIPCDEFEDFNEIAKKL